MLVLYVAGSSRYHVSFFYIDDLWMRTFVHKKDMKQLMLEPVFRIRKIFFPDQNPRIRILTLTDPDPDTTYFAAVVYKSNCLKH